MPKKKKGTDYVKNFCNLNVLLPWGEFVRILKKVYGFEMKSKPGSARLFIKGEIRFTAHEPHARESYVSKEDRKRACRFTQD